MSIASPLPPLESPVPPLEGDLGDPLGSLSAGKNGGGGKSWKGWKLPNLSRRKARELRDRQPQVVRAAPVRQAPAPASKYVPPNDRPRTKYGAPADFPGRIPKKGYREEARDAIERIMGKHTSRWYHGQMADFQIEFEKTTRAQGNETRRAASRAGIEAMRTMRAEMAERARPKAKPRSAAAKAASAAATRAATAAMPPPTPGASTP